MLLVCFKRAMLQPSESHCPDLTRLWLEINEITDAKCLVHERHMTQMVAITGILLMAAGAGEVSRWGEHLSTNDSGDSWVSNVSFESQETFGLYVKENKCFQNPVSVIFTLFC